MDDLRIERPADPEVLAPWSMVIDWENLTLRGGVAFGGRLLRDGKLFLSFENHGDGGCNLWSDYHDDYYGVWERDAKKAYPDTFEAQDYALLYLELRDGSEEEQNELLK